MATMPLGPSHQPPQPQTHSEIIKPLKLLPRRASEMDSDKVLHILSLSFTFSSFFFFFFFFTILALYLSL
jgi:hypothetical protein